MAKRADKRGGGRADEARLPTLNAHPRAARDLLRARGWGAVLGFLLAAALASGTGLPPAEILLRALVGGTAGMLAGWAACVGVWRAVASAEIRARERAWTAARAAADEPGDGHAAVA